MEKRYVKAIVGLILIFAMGLIGFYIFSAAYGDGLESTMQDNGVSEGEPVWSAPLNYGDNYGGSLMMGIVGFFLILFLMLGLFLRARSRKRAKQSN
jgi:cobalt/nickel transport protein